MLIVVGEMENAFKGRKLIFRNFISLNVIHCTDIIVLGLSLFNATFNNISVISWLSVLLVEETRVSDR